MDRRLLGLAILFFASFLLFMAYLLTNNRVGLSTRATQNLQVSTQNSLIFAWPLTIKADGTEQAEVTVFIRNPEGVAIPDRQVVVTTDSGTFLNNTATTDQEGQAVFQISASSPGIGNIKASVDGEELQRTVSVKFE